jgi:hypothetical protein
MTLVRVEFTAHRDGYLVAELDVRWRWSVRAMEGQATAIAAQVRRYLQLVHGHPVDPYLPWIGAEAAARSAIQALGMGKITYVSDGSRPSSWLESDAEPREGGRRRTNGLR